jgi:hypothetical protein
VATTQSSCYKQELGLVTSRRENIIFISYVDNQLLASRATSSSNRIALAIVASEQRTTILVVLFCGSQAVRHAD